VSHTLITFYKFFDWPGFEELKDPVKTKCRELNIKGTILLAAEGINATITGEDNNLTKIIEYLENLPDVGKFELKYSYAEEEPFKRLKVKLKKEIVTMGLKEVDPKKAVGTYVKPEQWDEITSDPDVILIDTRNDYEIEIGTFKGAVNPETDSFREFPEYVEKNLNPDQNKKVALFCTGGIRCEKATSYLVENGFEEVYHLEGGILKYLENVPEEKSSWEGECYVFDDRVTVKHGLENGTHSKCTGCGMPLSPEELESKHYEAEICCPKCYMLMTPERRRRREMRKAQLFPE